MNQKLHILFLCGWYPSKVLPTNGDFIQRHAEAVALKHNVTVIHIISDKSATQKIQIDTKNSNHLTTHIAYIKPSTNPIIKGFRFYNAYRQLLKKIGSVDHVHVNTLFPFGIFALHLKWFKKIPFIISEHWTGYQKPQSQDISFLEKAISKRITKSAAFVCPVSIHLKKEMVLFGLKGNYSPVPNVVDTELFSLVDKKEKSFTIVHVSSMTDTHKNISGMLRVAKRLETEIGAFTWKFIGGTSEQFDVLIEQLNFNRANVQFIDHVSQVELANHIQTAHLFVLFSNYENLPCVILEAFSCGIPVISTNVGGISEYFPDDFGFLIEKQNQHQLLRKIRKMYHNPISNSNAMHEYVITHFSRKTIATHFSELYYKSLKQQS
ncbi:MAG: glycosyltransferase family 4 protein [Polaribacter sp.]|nr:glycosyltransferase family 4 protein [Polaribacter sp.]